MSPVAHKRTIMTLYSDIDDAYCHRVRIALAEKGISVDVIEVYEDEECEDLRTINPYYSVPTLVDRELILYNSTITMEYLDERFPHPPLLPIYPVFRAKSRLLMHRIDNDWYSLMNIIKDGTVKEAEVARKDLSDALMLLAPVFADKPFFLSEEFTLVDCCIAPLLWRLPKLGVVLPPQGKPIIEYAERMFERESFQVSLTEVERELRVA